jgi:hypothetical protein
METIILITSINLLYFSGVVLSLSLKIFKEEVNLLKERLEEKENTSYLIKPSLIKKVKMDDFGREI